MKKTVHLALKVTVCFSLVRQIFLLIRRKVVKYCIITFILRSLYRTAVFCSTKIWKDLQ